MGVVSQPPYPSHCCLSMLLCVSLTADTATSILVAVCLFCAAMATALVAAAAVDAMMQALLLSSNG